MATRDPYESGYEDGTLGLIDKALLESLTNKEFSLYLRGIEDGKAYRRSNGQSTWLMDKRTPVDN